MIRANGYDALPDIYGHGIRIWLVLIGHGICYALYKPFACATSCQSKLAIWMCQSSHGCRTDEKRSIGLDSQNGAFGVAARHILHDSGPKHYSSVKLLILTMGDQIRSRGRVECPCLRSQNMAGNILKVVTRDELEKVRLHPWRGLGLLACCLLYRFNALFLIFR